MNTSQFIKQTWIGKSCRLWRETMDYKLAQISEETGFSVPTISQFEHGLNDNVLIFMWYIEHGFNVDQDFIEPLHKRKVSSEEFNHSCIEYHALLASQI